MRWILLVSCMAILGYGLFPRADIVISTVFYSPEHGFALEWHPLLRNIYLAVRHVSNAYIVALLVIALSGACCSGWRHWRAWRYLALVLLIGPLLMIEGLSKEYIQRPRPREIVEFGGKLDYVPPLAIGRQGGKSFVSNHAAAGFYVIAFAFLLQGKKRILIYTIGLTLGAAIGMVRVIQGGHFISDIVFSGLIMLWTIHLLAWIILREKSLKSKECV